MHRRNVALYGDRFFEIGNRAIGITMLAHCKTEQMQGIRILGLAGKNLLINRDRIAYPAALVQRDGLLHRPGDPIVLSCHLSARFRCPHEPVARLYNSRVHRALHPTSHGASISPTIRRSGSIRLRGIGNKTADWRSGLAAR